MKKVNYHMHTKRCMHASGTDEEYIVSCIKNGFDEVGFSDHSPWRYDDDFVAHMRMPLSEYQGYYDSIRSLQEKYKDQISIKIGLEVEFYHKYMDWLMDFLRQSDLDYIIFGNHYYETDQLGIYYGNACGIKNYMVAYGNSTVEGLETGIYSYLAHPNLFLREVPCYDKDVDRLVREICDASVRTNTPLEYNLTEAKIGLQDEMVGRMHELFWDTVKEYGCKVIIGFDAHRPSALGDTEAYNAAIQYLEDKGIERIDTIEFKRWLQK